MKAVFVKSNFIWSKIAVQIAVQGIFEIGLERLLNLFHQRPLLSTTIRHGNIYKTVFELRSMFHGQIEILLYEVPYITTYTEFSGESISGIINEKSSSIWPMLSIFSPAM